MAQFALDPMSVSSEVLKKWQRAIDVLASVVEVPVAMVMRLNGPDLEVLVSSHSEGNPYAAGHKEILSGSGLFCEEVVETKQKLAVPNALADEKWSSNTYLEFGLVAYLGYPLFLPDGQVFGTICVLDREEKQFKEQFQNLILEIKGLLEAHLLLIELNTRLYRSLEEISSVSHELHKTAKTDHLTGLLNRHSFAEALEVEVSRGKRYGTDTCLVLSDVDQFKQVNDQLGHNAGDQALIEVAQIVRDRLRKHDLAWRWGGDEFLLLLPQTTLDGASIVAEDIRRLIEEMPFEWRGTAHPLTISVGLVALGQGEDVVDCLERCDRMLYKAKRMGRNAVKWE
ncbi:MAG: sensor domain-containing diguanylate cyclase [Proteobacteria bacterium]|nr:sensor domain-containing diguanylate cyclase [Pseudomonadota bacterium]